MEDRFVSVPFISVNSKNTTVFERVFDKLKFEFVKPKIENRPTFKNHIGGLSDKAKSNLKKSIDNFLLMIDNDILITGKGKENITFVTLTLPSSQIEEFKQNNIKFYATDKAIKSKCLNQFLVELRSKYGLNNYIWVSEKQVNANIHFHLLLDISVPFMELRILWNRIINKFGFVDRYTDKFKNMSFEEYCLLRGSKSDTAKLRKSYDFGVQTSWQQPNSTDIHRLKKVKNISTYIAKYMSKGNNFSDKDKMTIAGIRHQYNLTDYDIEKLYFIGGRIWQCSQPVSKSRKLVVYLEPDLDKELNDIAIKEKNNIIDLSKYERNKKQNHRFIKIFIDEHFTVYQYAFKYFKENFKQIYALFINSINNWRDYANSVGGVNLNYSDYYIYSTI